MVMKVMKMKPSTFVGIVLVGFMIWGIIGFVMAASHPNPGHGGSEICDNFLCVAQASGSPLIGIGITTPSASLHVNAANGNLLRLERSDLTNGAYLLFNQNNNDIFSILTAGASILTFGSSSSSLNLDAYGSIRSRSNGFIFPDNTIQTSEALITGSCVTRSDVKNNLNTASASCNAGEFRLGGGCKSEKGVSISPNPLVINMPSGSDGWTCTSTGGASGKIITAYAVCCS